MLIFYHVKKTWWNQGIEKMLTNYSDGFIPKWSKRTFMDKYLVLDKYFYKMCSQSPYWSPVSLSHVLFESDDLSRVPGLRKMCTDHEGMAVHSPRIPVQSNHLISIEGLLCRLCCAGQAAKESGLVSFSLRPVLPQNTLSNSFLRESPCLSWIYFRNAVVHCRVVALSVSALQNGTKRFNSSQQMRILRLLSLSIRLCLSLRWDLPPWGPLWACSPRFDCEDSEDCQAPCVAVAPSPTFWISPRALRSTFVSNWRILLRFLFSACLHSASSPTLIQTCSGKALFLLPNVCLVDSISCW